MKKRLGGLAIAVAGVIAFASPAAAVPILVTPGYTSVITTEESTTFEFTGCDGTVEFVLAYFVDGAEVFTFLGSAPGGGGSYTFSWPTPGTYKIIVNCFVDGVKDSADFVFVDVVEPAVPTTEPATTEPPTTAPATTAAATTAPTSPASTAPATTGAPGASVVTATTSASTTSAVAALGPVTTPKASTLRAGALPATGQGGNAAMLAAAVALVAVGGTLVLVRRRPA